MIFPRVYLLQNSADAGFVSPHDNKQMFDDKPDVAQFVDDLYMRQSLLIRTNFVLTFRN